MEVAVCITAQDVAVDAGPLSVRTNGTGIDVSSVENGAVITGADESICARCIVGGKTRGQLRLPLRYDGLHGFGARFSCMDRGGYGNCTARMERSNL